MKNIPPTPKKALNAKPARSSGHYKSALSGSNSESVSGTSQKTTASHSPFRLQFPLKSPLSFEALSTPFEHLASHFPAKPTLHSRILYLQQKYEQHARQTYIDDYGIA